MTQNPNWPLIDIAVSFDSGVASAMPAPHWCSLKARSLGTLATARGRQYELDQIQTGTWTGSLENTDAALDPANAASPFYPNVLPYRMFRHRAQYPATVNLLTADQATAFYASQGSGGAGSTLPPNVFSLSGSALSVGYSAGIGTNYYAVQVPANTQYATVAIGGWSVLPGGTFSAQCQVNSPGGLTLQIALEWVDINGNTISQVGGTTTNVTTGSNQLTVTGTAPANATGAVVYVQNNTTSASSTSFPAWLWQVEQNSAPSAYVQPNPWYSVFMGYVERWPQSWNANGQFGMSNLTVVDAFGFLSQTKLLSPVYMEMMSLVPDFLYPLDEPSGATLFYDLAAKLSPATILTAQGGNAEQLQPGTSLTTGSNPLPQGWGGPVIQFDNQNASYSGYSSALLPTSLSGMGSAGFTRVFAFRCTSSNWPGAGAVVTMWNATDNKGNQIIFSGNPLDELAVEVVRSGTGTYNSSTSSSIQDKNWHMVALTCSADGKTWTTYFDGVQLDQQVLASDGRPLFTGTTLDQLGEDIYNWQGASNGYTGDIALAAQYSTPLTSSQISQLYSVFQHGGSGWGTASSTTRYQDILRWAKWPGLQAVDSYTSGECVAYGPASELLATAADTGTDAVSALQTVVDTDAGAHYVAADGTVTFKARRARYNQSTPVVTFGERGVPLAPRVNFCTNPSFETGVSGWLTSGSTLTQDTTTFYKGTASGKMVTTAAGQAIYASPPFTVPPGAVYTASAWVNGTGTVKIALASHPGGNIFASYSLDLLGIAWQRVSVTGYAPAGATDVYILVYNEASGTNTMWVDAVLLEQSSSLGTYFDGSMASDGVNLYAWSGKPLASPSVAIPVNLPARTNFVYNPSFETGTTGWTVTGGTLSQDTTTSYSGTSSGLWTTTAAAELYTAAYTATGGLSYTASAWVKGTGTVTFQIRTSGGRTMSQEAITLSGEWQFVSVTAQVPSIYNSVFPLFVSSSGTFEMWVDEVLLEQSEAVGTYFDGSTPDTLLYTYSWVATAGDSPSDATPAPTEVPYLEVKTGYDNTRLANDVSTVQTQTSQTQRATSTSSTSAYGDIQLQRNVNTLNPYEQSDAAQYLVLRNSTPVQRVEGISVNVGANPSLWAAMLGLELGSRVRVMRRPPLGAATIQVDGFVEQLNWTFDDKGHAAVDLQISVNNQQQYWQLDSSAYSILDSTTIVGY